MQKTNKWKHAIQNEYFLVAEKTDIIVGLASLINNNYINFMFVHKNYLHQGIASLLYNNILVAAKKQHSHQLSADVSITAIPFFEAKDFKVIKENINIINDVEIINYHMILKI
ncbi:GNAT family N-acetyltransferase [Wenyingzhuangia sp. IMCC45467]